MPFHVLRRWRGRQLSWYIGRLRLLPGQPAQQYTYSSRRPRPSVRANRLGVTRHVRTDVTFICCYAVQLDSCSVARRHPVRWSQPVGPCAATCTASPSAHVTFTVHRGVFCTCAHSGPLAASQHVAGADRVPRGKTWPMFRLRALLPLVLLLLAAAQLERCAA